MMTTHTVRLLDRSGAVLGQLSLPATTRLFDLAALRILGAARVELIE